MDDVSDEAVDSWRKTCGPGAMGEEGVDREVRMARCDKATAWGLQAEGEGEWKMVSDALVTRKEVGADRPAR